VSDCSQRLTEARTALHALMVGQLVVSVDVDGHRVQYSQARRDELEQYVKRLEAECGDAATVRVRRRPIYFRG
jgi:hypothetical protein